jgi:hypothetical protein
MTVDEVIKFYGNEVKSAANVGVSVQTVYNWKTSGIPRLTQLAIQTLTKNKLKADQE